MNIATVSAFIDKWHPQKDGNCSVSIRVTSQRKKKYYPTGISLKAPDFERIMIAKRRSEADKEVYNKIHSFESKAIEAVGTLSVFTFGMFEDIYLENRDAADSIAFGFDKYIKELREENRIGTAVSYEVAKKSIESFKKGLKYADITKAFLMQYENWMLEKEKSKTTVGIYLRSLRAIFNRASIDKSLYPFGEGKGKYSIPTSKNIKKALTLEEIAKIFNYQPTAGTNEGMAKDYWIFIYLCNGLNVKDLCLLKRKNIEGNILKYERAKTKRSKKDSEKIVVSLKSEALAIIKTWGVPSINPESYVFPHLQKGITAERERQIIQQLTKTINKFMKRIAGALKINKEVTTYFARHSFATVLRNSGVSMEFISEALGHSDMKTTKSYLAGFEVEKIHETTNALTAFSK
ncbi:tyrosine-type recombinase/integrase [Ferruginibacter profundus]